MGVSQCVFVENRNLWHLRPCVLSAPRFPVVMCVLLCQHWTIVHWGAHWDHHGRILG